VLVLAYGSHISDDPATAMDKDKELFVRDVFNSFPVMVHKPVDPCRCEYLWYKGNTNIP
jgi:hypothetical protein